MYMFLIHRYLPKSTLTKPRDSLLHNSFSLSNDDTMRERERVQAGSHVGSDVSCDDS